jgi:hypothetical protein
MLCWGAVLGLNTSVYVKSAGQETYVVGCMGAMLSDTNGRRKRLPREDARSLTVALH